MLLNQNVKNAHVNGSAKTGLIAHDSRFAEHNST